MNEKKHLLSALLILLVAMPGGARATDSSCWTPPELTAYDITMQTLMMAHVTANCDAVNNSDPPLRAAFAKFLGRNGAQLDADRAALSRYYQRAYGTDWETPLRQSLDREESRVDVQVKQTATPQFCGGAGNALGALEDESWSQYVAEARRQGWHDKAGLPVCR